MDQANPSASERVVDAGTVNWKQKLAHEIRLSLWLFLYLWVVLGLLMLHESVVLSRHDIIFTRYGFALVTALILAKVMLILEKLPIGRVFENKPLYVPILFKSAVYAVVFLAFLIAEEAIGWLVEGKSVSDSIPSIGGGTPQGYTLTLVIFSLALVPYFTFTEIGRVIGTDKLHRLIFTRAGRLGDAGKRPARQT